MTLSSKGASNHLHLPRALFPLLISVISLALFLVVASQILISFPVSSTIQEYAVNLDNSMFVFFGSSGTESQLNGTVKKSANGFEPSGNLTPDAFSYFLRGREVDSVAGYSSQNGTDVKPVKGSILEDTKNKQIDTSYSLQSVSGSSILGSNLFENASKPLKATNMVMPPPQVPSNQSKQHDFGNCNLYHGRWIFDTAGPLYSNNTCPIITQTQNCQGNGRPDKDYENWRWKPDQCVLPRFDAKKFLQIMKGKTLAFVGDSIARNQMESMLCILWQVETPTNRGNRRMHRWIFKSTSTTIIRIWSSWLVHVTNDPIQFAPEGIPKLHLDAPDEAFMEYLPKFDVLVISSGHWSTRKSVYVLNGTVVGGQLWQPNKSHKMLVNNIDAFGISQETALTSIAMHPTYKGLTIARSFSPDHYENGAWNSGGSCTDKVKPAMKLARNEFTDIMHEKQVKAFEKAVINRRNLSKLRLMDITEVFGYRHDGHPGLYRSPDSNKMTKRGPNGKPPPQDCLHWCLPGPIDTWNELLFEIIQREFEAGM